MPRNQIAGTLLAAFAMFAFGTLYWGFNPLPYQAWKKASNDEALGKALLEYLPAEGTYYLPGMYNDAATLERLHNKGPIAFIHLTDRDGRPRMEPSVMIKGFLLYIAVGWLFWLLLSGVNAASRLRTAALVALIAAVMIDLGDTIWWFLPLEWKLFQFVYSFVALFLGGAVQARFGYPAAK
jgi:hypothetical protein